MKTIDLLLPCACRGSKCECEASVYMGDTDSGRMRIGLNMHNYYVDLDAYSEAKLLEWLQARAERKKG